MKMPIYKMVNSAFYFLLIFFISTNISQADIIITEIADPDQGSGAGTGARYIEIHNSGGSSVALTDYYIIRFTNNNSAATTKINLSSYTLAAGGFLIFAVNSTTFSSTFSVGPATVVDAASGGPSDSNGDDNHAIVTEASGQTFDHTDANTYDIVDMFGVVGEDGNASGGTWHEFEDGRAERVSTATSASGATASSSDWNCFSDSETWLAGVDQNAGNSLISTTTSFTNNGFDPGAWDGYKSLSISGTFGFRLLSTPVSAGTYSDLLDELWTQGMTNSDAPGATDDNVWSFSLGSNEAGSWPALSDLDVNMIAGAGFLVFAFADNNNDGTDDLPQTLSVSGTENSGDVRYPAGSTTIDASQYAYAGNPYYTTIGWDDVARTQVEAPVYVYDDARSLTPGYIEWNGTSGDLTDGLIAPFQGFCVQATESGGGYITIQEADKSTSSGTFYRMLDNDNEGSMYLEVTASDSGYNKTWFTYREDGENTLDGRDAHKLMPLMASDRLVAMTHTGNNSLNINNLPFGQEGAIQVPLDVMSLTLEDGNYVTGPKEVTINWDIEELPDHISMTLTDNITGSETYLDYESEYVFTTEPKGSFSATYDGPIGTYPVVGEPRFTLSVAYGALGQNEDATLPSDFTLHPVYPNPFNPSATISFDIPKVSGVELSVYDVKGALVETLLQDNMKPGKHHYTWEPQGLSSGVYFMKLTTVNKSFTQKVTYIK